MKRWSEMSPRERDVLIAEKITGSGDRLIDSVHSVRLINVPNYSTDIAAAWEVVEHLRPKFGFSLTDWPDNKPGQYEASFDFRDGAGEGYPSYEAEADTAPEAICLAALKALNIKV